MTQGIVIIKTGTLGGAPELITATDDINADPISDFDIIGVNYLGGGVGDAEVRFRRSGQGSPDTSYITLEMRNSSETFDAAAGEMVTAGSSGSAATVVFHNVGLPVPVLMMGGSTAAQPITSGIHNFEAVCDAIEIGEQINSALVYEVWGIYDGKSKVIQTIDFSTWTSPHEILVDGDTLSLDNYENIRVVMVAKAPTTGTMEIALRDKASGLYLTSYIFTSWNSSTDGDSDDAGVNIGTTNQHAVAVMRGFGLPVMTQANGQWLGTTNQSFMSGDVGSAGILDGLKFTATGGTPTTGKIYITGMLI